MSNSLPAMKVVLADSNIGCQESNVAYVKPMPTATSGKQIITSSGLRPSSVAKTGQKYLQSTVNINGVLKNVLVPMTDNVASTAAVSVVGPSPALATAKLSSSALASRRAISAPTTRAFYVVSDPTISAGSKSVSNISIAVPVTSGGYNLPMHKVANGGATSKSALIPGTGVIGTGPSTTSTSSSTTRIILQLQPSVTSATSSSTTVRSTVSNAAPPVQSPNPTVGSLLKQSQTTVGTPTSNGQNLGLLMDHKQFGQGSVYVYDPTVNAKTATSLIDRRRHALPVDSVHNLVPKLPSTVLNTAGRPITSAFVQAPIATPAKQKPLMLRTVNSTISTASGQRQTILVAYPKTTSTSCSTPLNPSSVITSRQQGNVLSTKTNDLIQPSSQSIIQKLTSVPEATAKIGPARQPGPIVHSIPGFNSGSPLKSILKLTSSVNTDSEPQVINIGDSDSQLRIDSVFSLQEQSEMGSFLQEEDDDIPMMDEESLNNMKVIEIVPDDDYQSLPNTSAEISDDIDKPGHAERSFDPTESVPSTEDTDTVTESPQCQADDQVMRGDNMQVRIAQQAARQMQSRSNENGIEDDPTDNFTSQGALDFRALLISPKQEAQSLQSPPTPVASVSQSTPVPRRGSRTGLKIPRYRKKRKIKAPLLRFRDTDKKYLARYPTMRHSVVKLETLYLSGKITVKANPRTIRLLKTRPLWHKPKKSPRAGSTSSTDTAPSPPEGLPSKPESSIESRVEGGQVQLLNALKLNSVSLSSLSPSVRPSSGLSASAIRPKTVPNQGAPILLRSQGSSPRLAFARPVTPNSTSKNKYFLVKTSSCSFLVPVNQENLKLAQSILSRRDLSHETLRSMLKPIAGLTSVATGTPTTTVTVRRTNIMGNSVAKTTPTSQTTPLPIPIATVIHRPTGKTSAHTKTTVVFPQSCNTMGTGKTHETNVSTSNTMLVYSAGTKVALQSSALQVTPPIKQESTGLADTRPRKRNMPEEVIDLEDGEPVTKRPQVVGPPPPKDNAEDRIKRLKESLQKQNEQLLRIRKEREESRKALEELEKDV